MLLGSESGTASRRGARVGCTTDHRTSVVLGGRGSAADDYRMVSVGTGDG
jgi:hypothetical protein